MIEKIQYSPPKISTLVMQEMISAIKDGRIQIGEKLPSERKLAEMLGISRPPLRESLAVLEFLGVIERRGHRKLVVCDAEYIQDVNTIVQSLKKIRKSLEQKQAIA